MSLVCLGMPNRILICIVSKNIVLLRKVVKCLLAPPTTSAGTSVPLPLGEGSRFCAASVVALFWASVPTSIAPQNTTGLDKVRILLFNVYSKNCWPPGGHEAGGLPNTMEDAWPPKCAAIYRTNQPSNCRQQSTSKMFAKIKGVKVAPLKAAPRPKSSPRLSSALQTNN